MKKWTILNREPEGVKKIFTQFPLRLRLQLNCSTPNQGLWFLILNLYNVFFFQDISLGDILMSVTSSPLGFVEMNEDLNDGIHCDLVTQNLIKRV